MIGDFFRKPIGWAKFQRFHNIMMNIDHDEFEPVGMDELMAIHHEKRQRRFEMERKKEENKPTKKKKSSNLSKGVG